MFCVTGANWHGSVVFESLVDALPAVAVKPDRPRRLPDKFHDGKDYDFARCRKHLLLRSIKDRIARRGVERNDRLGRHRWVVERTHAWGWLSLACSIICVRTLQTFC